MLKVSEEILRVLDGPQEYPRGFPGSMFNAWKRGQDLDVFRAFVNRNMRDEFKNELNGLDIDWVCDSSGVRNTYNSVLEQSIGKDTATKQLILDQALESVRDKIRQKIACYEKPKAGTGAR